jgi:hypothetical protein
LALVEKNHLSNPIEIWDLNGVPEISLLFSCASGKIFKTI